MNKINQIRQKIKDFTKQQPTDLGELDFSYRIYLAKCAKLLEQDLRLVNIENLGLFDEETEILIDEIKIKVEEYTSFF